MEHRLNQSSRRVKRLDDQVAKKIAAGEVIERPSSVVRELLDNALDSNASSVAVSLVSGGLESIEVTDTGYGMTKEDLELCWLSHATSKISHEDDLLSIHSLGFRGEALSSIAAVSRTTILSSLEGSGQGYRLALENSKLLALEPTPWDRGTKVQVADLFYNLPARKKFLKRPGAESTQCKTTFFEKALAFPMVDFEFSTDGGNQVRLLPQEGDRPRLHRVLDCYPDLGKPQVFWELAGSGSGFSFQLVLGDTNLYRRDKRFIQIFVNNRRIQEYSLVQAIDYGCQGFFHGGTFPIAFLFLEVEPSQIDFNIHPAKREAKFLQLQEIHHRVSRTVQDHLKRATKKQFGLHQTHLNLTSFQTESRVSLPSYPSQSTNQSSTHSSTFSSIHSPTRKTRDNEVFDLSIRYTPQTIQRSLSKPEISDQKSQQTDTSLFRYLGLAFQIFLIVEVENKIIFIDMHAAHEKILYNNHRKNPKPQSLLIPIEIPLDGTNNITQELFESLKPLGFDGMFSSVSHTNEIRLEITQVPGALSGKEFLIRDFFEQFTGNAEDLERRLYSTMSCRAAIMQGDYLEQSAAEYIIRETLAMEDPRCPHGRPLWFELTKEDLFKFIGRD